jgi:class 3 adenylate cyclase
VASLTLSSSTAASGVRVVDLPVGKTGRVTTGMQPWQEPVRGAPLPPAAYALDGLDRLRGYGQGLWLGTPNHHLFGFRSTQAGNGSAVGTMPVNGWLAHPDGVIEIGLLVDSVCGMTAETVAPAGAYPTPLHISYSPVRLVDPTDTRTIVGRAHVVRTSPDWVFVEGSVEDDAGRLIAGMSGHLRMVAVDFDVPHDPPNLVPVDPPKYPTPDPFRRPVPSDKEAGCAAFHEYGCVEWLGRVITGEAPLPPLYELLGIRPLSVADGAVSTILTTSPWLQAMDGGAFCVSTLAVDCCGAATWTLAEPGTMPGMMEATTTFLDAEPLPVDGTTLTASATAERVGNVLLSTVEVTAGERRVASGATVGRLIERRSGALARPDRVLATVLFTDIVGSTEHAERLGDTAWHELLTRHQGAVRSAVAEHGGREVKTTGDGFVVTFDAPTRALECARAIRDAVSSMGVEIRAGLHTGEIVVAVGDISGIAVHTAARIEAAAGPGEIWASDTVRALASGSGLSLKDRGWHNLKGIEGEVQLFSVEE